MLRAKIKSLEGELAAEREGLELSQQRLAGAEDESHRTAATLVTREAALEAALKQVAELQQRFEALVGESERVEEDESKLGRQQLVQLTTLQLHATQTLLKEALQRASEADEQVERARVEREQLQQAQLAAARRTRAMQQRLDALTAVQEKALIAAAEPPSKGDDLAEQHRYLDDLAQTHRPFFE